MAHRPSHSAETNNVDVVSLPSGKPTYFQQVTYKAAGGAGIVCAGTALSLATGMQVVFYGAIIMGSFWCLAGIVQAVIGEKTV